MNPPPYLWAYILYTCLMITGLVLLGIAGALHRSGVAVERTRAIVRRSAILFFGWLGLAALTGWLGVYRASADRDFPFIALALGIPITIGVLLIRRSTATREVLAAVPQSWLVGVQFYRGLGSVFLLLYGVGLLPGVFALPAGFGDVLVGLLALVVAACCTREYASRSRLLIAWNILGLVDLAIALGTGFLSAPTKFQVLALGNPNQLVGAFPLVLVPIYAVPLSVILHIASLTKLAWETKPDEPGGSVS